MKLKQLLVASLLTLCAFSQTAFAAKTDVLHGEKTSLTRAKTLASGAFYDGTNVILVNFSHSPVSVDIPTLGQSFTLGSINDADNVYYVYSQSWYDRLWVNIYDTLDGTLIASGYTDNPSTMEVRDALYSAKAGKTSQPAHPRVTYKQGV